MKKEKGLALRFKVIRLVDVVNELRSGDVIDITPLIAEAINKVYSENKIIDKLECKGDMYFICEV